MKLNSGEFITYTNEGSFVISITQEGDLSLDGGYSFENKTNEYTLGRSEAISLIDELNEYVRKTT